MAGGPPGGTRLPAAPLVESVPNISEGRRPDVVDAVLRAVRSSGPVLVLDVSSDPDHNRSVLTIAGGPGAVRDALLALAAVCVERIDLRQHRGAHPRMGAVDVIPIVPIRGVTMDECVSLARDVGHRLAERHGLPVYLYERAATAPHRRNLADLRRGEFEGFAEKIRDPRWAPDFGPPAVHPSAGCVAVGAREFLIAYNINLDSPDLDLAREIARAIREKDGGFPCVKAMGVFLQDRNRAQVSINMTDYRVTSLRAVFERVGELAARRGVSILESEIVGLVPAEALVEAGVSALKLRDFDPSALLERRLEQASAAEGGGA